MKKFVTIIIVLVALQLALVSVSFAAPPASGGDWGGGEYYRVHYGDTLFSIGRHFGMNPYRIAEVNNLYNPNYIYAGQWLYIPARQSDCYSGCYDQSNYHQPRRHGQNPCYGGGHGCDGYSQQYGYDYTGYYYEGRYPQSNRYSYTCGYNYNCW